VTIPASDFIAMFRVVARTIKQCHLEQATCISGYFQQRTRNLAMIKTKDIRVVAVRLGEEPTIETWTYKWDTLGKENKNRASAQLKLFQEFVGGQVEPHPCSGRDVMIYVNGDGLRTPLPYNSCGIVGNYVFYKCDHHGWTQSLTDDECRKCLAWCQANKNLPEPKLKPFKIYVGKAAEKYVAEQQMKRQEMAQRWESLSPTACPGVPATDAGVIPRQTLTLLRANDRLPS
jgi:hypothetical protein